MRGSNSSFSTMALTNCSFSGTESSTLSTNRLSTAVSTSLVDVMVRAAKEFHALVETAGGRGASALITNIFYGCR